jgi:hypothetical protein
MMEETISGEREQNTPDDSIEFYNKVLNYHNFTDVF